MEETPPDILEPDTESPAPPGFWQLHSCPPPQSSWLLTLLTILLAVIFTIIYRFLFYSTSVGALQDRVARMAPLFLDINFGLLVLAVVINFKDFRSLGSQISRQTWVLLGLITLAGFLITCLLAPRTHRIYYDEDIYGNIGLCISHAGRAVMTHQGMWSDGNYILIEGTFNKQANAYPYLLSLIYRVTGPSETLSYLMNNFAIAASILTVFFISLFVFGKESLALYASLIFATIPNNHRWGNTMAAEPTTALFAGLAILSTLFYVQRPKSARLLLLAAVTALAVQFRMESVLVGGVMALIIVLWRPTEYLGNRLYLAVLLFLILIPHHFCHIYSVRDNKWGSDHGKFALHNLWTDMRVPNIRGHDQSQPLSLRHALEIGEFRDGNLYQNIRFFFWDDQHRFPVPYGWLFLLGLLIGGPIRLYRDWNGRKLLDFAKGFFFEVPWRGKAVIFSWFAWSWGIFLFFYAGSYFYGADDRFSLLCFMPVSIFAGVAVEKSERIFRHWLSGWQAATFATVFLLMVYSRYIPVSKGIGHEAWLARADHAFAHDRIAELPPDSVVLSHNPSIYNLQGVSSVQTWYGKQEPGLVQSLIEKHSGGVYLHWGFWATILENSDHRSNVLETLKNFHHTYLKTQRLTHETDKWERTFHWIRLHGRRTPASGNEGQKLEDEVPIPSELEQPKRTIENGAGGDEPEEDSEINNSESTLEEEVEPAAEKKSKQQSSTVRVYGTPF